MSRIPLEICYKGQRNYIQGGDLYSAIIKYLPPDAAPFRLTIHRFATKSCDIVFSETDYTGPLESSLIAEFAYATGSEKRTGRVIETENTIDCRAPFEEEKIEALCTIDKGQNEIIIAGESGFTPIEVVISMAKNLHYSLYSSEGKWIFVRLDLERLFQPDDRRLRIGLKHNLNNRLTKSLIESDGIGIGHIFFSLIKV